jgi:hypothetical protein
MMLLRDERRGRGVQASNQHPHVLGQRLDEVAAEAQGLDTAVGIPEEEAEVEERADPMEPNRELGWPRRGPPRWRRRRTPPGARLDRS